MKHMLLKSFIIVCLLSTVGFALADQGDVFINNNLSNIVIVTEYKCKTLKMECVVDRIKYIQTGNTFYDAECDGSVMRKSSCENDVINDVQSGRFDYCTRTGRTIKGAN